MNESKSYYKIRPNVRRTASALAIHAVLMVVVAALFFLTAFIRPANSSVAIFLLCASALFVVLTTICGTVWLRFMLTCEISKDGLRKHISGSLLAWKWEEIREVHKVGIFWLFSRRKVPSILRDAYAMTFGGVISAPELLDDTTLLTFHRLVSKYASEDHPLARKLASTKRVRSQLQREPDGASVDPALTPGAPHANIVEVVPESKK